MRIFASPVSAESQPTPADGATAAARPSLLVGGGHLAALWALALAQPLFDLLGRNPDFFVARGNSSSDIVVFALVFTLLPPLAMVAVEAIALRISPRLRWAIHLGLVGLLSAALAMQVAKQLIGRPAGLLLVIALEAGALVAVFYDRRFLRSLLDVLIPAPVIVLAAFLFFSDVSELVLPRAEAGAIHIQIPRPAPVVWIVFDEFPEGSLMTPGGAIDGRRYPAFAELGRRSTWYRNATTVAGFTSRAVPTLLTGRLPDSSELPIAADQPHSVFTLLGRSYEMRVMENATRICPAALCPGEEQDSAPQDERLTDLFSDLRVVSEHLLLPNAWRNSLPDVSQTFGDFAGEGQSSRPILSSGGNAEQLAGDFAAGVGAEESERIAEFASRIEPGQGAVLNLIHVEKPHYPWTHLPGGPRYTDLRDELLDLLDDGSVWQTTPQVTGIALQRHLLEAGYADHLLGRVIARLKRTGLWDRALVVVSADHGGAVIAGEPRRNPTARNLGQVGFVPLFVKAPGQRRGRVEEGHVCTSDVLPKVVDLLGARYPWARSPCPAARVTVADQGSGQASLPLATARRQREAYVARIQRLFGDGGWGGVFRFGPNSELIGRRVAALRPVPAPGQARAPRWLHRVDLGAPDLPFLLQRGSLEGGPGQPLALAANGRIAAVGRSFEEGGETRYSILLPPSALHDGANRIDLYRVRGTSAAARLQGLGA